MITNRIVLFLLPVVLFLLWLLLSTAIKKKPSRFSVNIVLSLLLFVYFSAVAGTGIFWVAAQELPVFDWHYLLGYILILLCLTHVVLNWKPIATWLRNRSPRAAKNQQGTRFNVRIKAVSLVVLMGAVVSIAFLAGGQFRGNTLSIVIPTPGSEAVRGKSNDLSNSIALPSIMLEVEGETMSLSRFYHRGCSYPARTRLTGVTWKEKPAVYKQYDGAKEIALPEIRPEGGGSILEASEAWRNTGSRLAESSITIDDLSLLLYHTQGINKVLEFSGRKYELRTAPSAGALYPVNIYLAVNRVQGIEPGLYYYNIKNHSLQQIRTGYVYPVLEEAAGCPHAYQPAAATVIMSTTFSRTGFKYKDRCYRYVNMDTGHAVANLGVCAASLGLAAPVVARFDDHAINRLLEIDSKEEAALVLIPLGKPLEEESASLFPEPDFRTEGSSLAQMGETNYLALIHNGTGLSRNGLWNAFPQFPNTMQPETAGAIILPDPVRGDDLYPVIRRRRSIRNHENAPMRLDELSTLCVAAAGSGTQKEPFLSMTAPLKLYAMVRDVDGLDPGVYLFHPGSRSLSLIKEGNFSNDTFLASYRQDFCGTADVVFIKTLEWDALSLPDGDRGYRYACLRSGIVGNGLYLAATALNLGPCGVGAFLDEEAAALIGCDTELESVLYLTAVGR